MTRILGLDLGTNSIGWAVVLCKEEEGGTSIGVEGLGSRVFPMDAATMGDYDKGVLKSAAADRRQFRAMRRLYERAALRRQRLLRVLNIMGFLPPHLREAVDFDVHPGTFKGGREPLLAYAKDSEGNARFIFMDAFNEMLQDFAQKQPQLVADGKRVPMDWTLYYLRHKALSQPISKQELAWILLNFNTKRGYHQLDEDDQEGADKTEEYTVLTVQGVVRMDEDKKRPGSYWWEITYENGDTQRTSSRLQPRREGDKVEVIRTLKTDKEGQQRVSLRTPKADDWGLMKKRTEHEIGTSKLTVGDYIYTHLLAHPEDKVRGKLVRVVERRFYREELMRILNKQAECMPEWHDPQLLEKCLRELYHHNEAHVRTRLGQSLVQLVVEDILFLPAPPEGSQAQWLPLRATSLCRQDNRRMQTRVRALHQQVGPPVPGIPPLAVRGQPAHLQEDDDGGRTAAHGCGGDRAIPAR